jgi:hypothetical protein
MPRNLICRFTPFSLVRLSVAAQSQHRKWFRESRCSSTIAHVWAIARAEKSADVPTGAHEPKLKNSP